MTDPLQPCPLSEEQIQSALSALASGRNLDPPFTEQQALVAQGARALLAEQHHWLVVGIAVKRTERDLGPRPVEEAAFDAAVRRRIAAGYPGLLKAQKDWDPTRGYKFGTWASWWIRQAIARAETDGRITLE